MNLQFLMLHIHLICLVHIPFTLCDRVWISCQSILYVCYDNLLIPSVNLYVRTFLLRLVAEKMEENKILDVYIPYF